MLIKLVTTWLRRKITLYFVLILIQRYTMINDKKIAVFFDCENISSKYLDEIFFELAKSGEVMIRQAYKIGVLIKVSLGAKKSLCLLLNQYILIPMFHQKMFQIFRL